MQNRRGKSWSVWVGVAIVAVLLAARPAATQAEPIPGTPLAVAPGVPGQGRAWELVTSPDPVSAVFWAAHAISPDGGRVVYSTIGLLPDAPVPKSTPATALATRGPEGWDPRSILIPEPDFGVFSLEAMPVAIDPDFEQAIWASEIEGFDVALFRSPRYGEYDRLFSTGRTSPVGGFVGASVDLRRVVAESDKHLVPADAGRTSGWSLYEAEGSEIALVDVDQGGEPISPCGASGEGISSVSDDGRRVFFSAAPGCTGPQRVFLRANGTTTTEVSASQCGLPDCGAPAPVDFVGATPSGATAFLVTAERLTDADSDATADLYRYDVEGGQLTLVTAATGGDDLIVNAGPDVVVSNDASRVYFRAVAETGPGETSAQRLYLAGPGGVRLVSAGVPGELVEATPDGRYASFTTKGQLVAGDTDAELDVYRFDAAAAPGAALDRVSAGPAGGNGPFEAGLRKVQGDVIFMPFSPVNHPFRVMSDDGRRIFFATAEPLLPADGNSVTDVYGWESGALALVSAGAGGDPTFFRGSTPDGETALFETAATLLPRDRDGGDPDFYVARVGGGFPETSPAGCVASCGARGERLDRSGPVTATAARTLRLGPLGPRERRRIVATGWIELLVEVPKAGRLSAFARARVGGQRRTVAETAETVGEAGVVHLRMRLAREARSHLARGGNLRVALRLRLSGLRRASRLGIELRGAR